MQRRDDLPVYGPSHLLDKKDGLPGTAASRGAAGIGRSAAASGTGFSTSMRRGDDRIVSGQKLCQILAPALLAAQGFLSFQNKKFIRLTTLLTTVLINRHIFSFTFANI